MARRTEPKTPEKRQTGKQTKKHRSAVYRALRSRYLLAADLRGWHPGVNLGAMCRRKLLSFIRSDYKNKRFGLESIHEASLLNINHFTEVSGAIAPTSELPGSPGKMEVLAARVAAGAHLLHIPGDVGYVDNNW